MGNDTFVKIILLPITLVFGLFIASFSAVAEPLFTQNLTYVNTTSVSNVMTFNATENISFEITITDVLNANWPNITNVTFQLGRPDGTFINFTTNFTGSVSTPAIQNKSNTVFYINFTQSMLGPAGTYNFTWFAKNETGPADFSQGVNANRTITTIFTVNKANLNRFLDVSIEGKFNESVTVTYPDAPVVFGRFNSTFASDVTFALFRNGTDVTSVQNNTNFRLSATTYEFIYGTANATAENYTIANSSSVILTVNKGAHTITIYVNGTTGGVFKVEKGSTVNITIASNATSDNNLTASMSLFTNYTGTNSSINTVGVGTVNVLQNITNTIGLNLTNFTISANISETANYSSSSNNTILLWVVDTLKPVINSFTKVKVGDFDLNGPISTSDFSCSVTDNSSVTTVISGLSTATQGKHTATCTSTDEGGNVASATLDYHVVAASSTAGGGGGTISPTGPELTRIYIRQIPAGITQTFDLKDIPLTKISVTPSDAVSAVVIDITVLKTKPADVEATEGKVLTYLTIDQANLPSTHVSQIKIEFKVDKSWINGNNIDVNKVFLSRFSNNVWERLPTAKIGEDSTSITYEATTRGFSVFAIEGDEVSEELPVTEPEEMPPTEEEVTPTEPTEEEAPPIELISRDTAIAIAIVIIIIIAAALTLMRRSGKRVTKRSF